MLGFGSLGEEPLGGLPLPRRIVEAAEHASLTVFSVVIPEEGLLVPETRVAQGTLIKSTSALWAVMAERLGQDWEEAFRLSASEWEELVAGAFKRDGYDEVILTPRSGDHGRDVIAVKRGVGCVKIIGSVKAYKPGHNVGYDDVRALLGVMSGERDVSKGIIATTSDFPPRIEADPFIAPFLPTRLELMNGDALRKWLAQLAADQT